MQYEIEI